jgi:hypothetical protein
MHNTRGSLTERVVEIPLLQYFLNQYPDATEIGCVSPYYQPVKHLIYDLTDSHSSCCKKNAKDIDLKNKNIVSISTIEHFDIDNYNISIEDRISPMDYIKQIMNEASRYLITIPLGYNSILTKSILEYAPNHINYIGFLTRDTDRWSEKKVSEIKLSDLNYNTEIWYANSICIIENIL